MRSKLVLLFSILLFYSSVQVFAQEPEAEKPLISILNKLQEQHSVQFNYASSLVDGVAIIVPSDPLPLKEYLSYISVHTTLAFEFIADNLISIKKKKPIVCGYLKDKDTGEPLVFVTVQSGNKGILTNEEGYFSLQVTSENDVIEIRHIGHRPISREVRYFNTQQCGTIYMVANEEQLTEVVLYSYLIRGVDKLDNGSYQIDFNKFTILPGLIEKDVLHSVQAFPGIQSIDETVSNLNIRGGSNDQNLITWDDIKMYQSGHFFGLISMYNPHITQKVSLKKNGSSASETDGVSGTIAMQTTNHINPTLEASVGVNLLDANAFVDAPINKNMSVQVAARKSLSDFTETPTYSKYFDRISQDTEIENNNNSGRNSDINFGFYDASFRVLYHPTAKDRFRFNFIQTFNSLTFNEEATVDGNQEIRESKLRQYSLAGGLQYIRDWSSSFSTEIDVYDTSYALKARNANILEEQRFIQENMVSETGVKLRTVKTFSPQVKWTNGYHYVETKVTNLDDVDNPQYVLLEGEVLRTHALFTEAGLASENKRSQLHLGVRYNYLDKFKKHIIEPRLSLSHSFAEVFNVELLGEFKHQNTSQVINFQNDFLGIEKRRWQLSNNTNIPVIRSKQGSLGLSYAPNGWLLNTVAFYKKVNGITTQSQGFQDNYEYVQVAGAYDAVGADVLLRKQVQHSAIWVGYSYLVSNYYFDEIEADSFPSNFDIRHTLTLGANYSWKQLLLATGLNWRTGKPFTAPINGNEVEDDQINYDVVNGEQQKDYMRVDISATYKFYLGSKTKAQLGFSIWNLLNRKNTINTFYRLNDSSDQVQEIEQSSLGLTPNASFRVLFN